MVFNPVMINEMKRKSYREEEPYTRKPYTLPSSFFFSLGCKQTWEEPASQQFPKGGLRILGVPQSFQGILKVTIF